MKEVKLPRGSLALLILHHLRLLSSFGSGTTVLLPQFLLQINSRILYIQAV